MTTVQTGKIFLFVDRASQQWIVRDEDGEFWTVPAIAEGWEHREPFAPTDETELEPIPGHYKYLLGLPVANRRFH